MKSLADTLRDAIKASENTHYAIAKLCGISPAILDRFVAGERDLRLETAAKIADVLGLRLTSSKRRRSTK